MGNSFSCNACIYSLSHAGHVSSNFTYCDGTTHSSISGECCGPDVTEWLHTEIANHRFYALNGPSIHADAATGLTPADSLYRMAVYGLAVDYGYVNYHGLVPNGMVLPGGGILRYSCDNVGTVTLCGRCRNASDMGNFVLGIAIHAGGWREVVAEQAADRFNALTDTSSDADRQGILLGYRYDQRGLQGERMKKNGDKLKQKSVPNTRGSA